MFFSKLKDHREQNAQDIFSIPSHLIILVITLLEQSDTATVHSRMLHAHPETKHRNNDEHTMDCGILSQTTKSSRSCSGNLVVKCNSVQLYFEFMLLDIVPTLSPPQRLLHKKNVRKVGNKRKQIMEKKLA